MRERTNKESAFARPRMGGWLAVKPDESLDRFPLTIVFIDDAGHRV